MKYFVLRNGEYYFRRSDGVLAQAISKTEVKVELKRVHNICRGDNDISLCRRLKRRGYYWPDMKKDVGDLQRK